MTTSSASSLASDSVRVEPGRVRPLVHIVLPDLRGGGAERTSVNVQRELSGGELDVKLVLLEPRGEYLETIDDDAWMLPPGRWLRALARRSKPDGVMRALLQLPQMLSLLLRARPDVVMTCMADISIPMGVALALLPRSRRPYWIARDGNNAKVVLEEAFPNPRLLRVIERIFRWAYMRADTVLVPSLWVGLSL